jgi:hypothetical protein
LQLRCCIAATARYTIAEVVEVLTDVIMIVPMSRQSRNGLRERSKLFAPFRLDSFGFAADRLQRHGSHPRCHPQDLSLQRRVVEEGMKAGFGAKSLQTSNMAKPVTHSAIP